MRIRRSPNYPSKPLDWAINSALSILEKEGLHSLPPDTVAKDIGYKNADSGPAKSSIAALKSYGLLEKEGEKLRLSESVQRYKLAPSEEGKAAILRQWFTTPTLFQTMIDKYSHPLPSDEVIVHDLVFESKYTEQAALKITEVFKSSLRSAQFEKNNSSEDDHNDDAPPSQLSMEATQSTNSAPVSAHTAQDCLPEAANVVRYPVRLAGGRMAYIEVPSEFRNKDKEKLKAQLEIIGTIDEDEEYRG